MSDSKERNLSTKEDKKIKYTLLLLEDNDQKLALIEKLRACMDKMSKFLIDDNEKQSLTCELNSMSNSMLSSHELNKTSLNKINAQAKQIEESCKRIKTSREADSIDAA